MATATGIESLDGTLSRIHYHKPSPWNIAGVPFLIGRLDTGVTIKGELLKPVEGERYRFWGEFRPQKQRPGEFAFEFDSYEVLIDETVDGVSRYLAEYVAGIGPTKAKAIVEHFGTDTLTILRKSPERAVEVSTVSINEAIVESIRKHFAENSRIDPVAYARLIGMVAGHKIPKAVVRDLVETFGSSAPDHIQEHPYDLLAYPRIGWQLADSFALTVCQYDPKGLDRHKCAVVEAVTRVTMEGHTYATIWEATGKAADLLSESPRPDTWEALVADGQLIQGMDVHGETTYTIPELHFAELTVASKLAELSAACGPLEFEINTDRLAGEQIAAAKIIEQNAVALLTGPPGTGKSWVAAQVIKSFVDNGIEKITFVAPTGKAAKRGAELLQRYVPGCKIVPSTIHRALGPMPSRAKEGVPESSAKTGRGRKAFGFNHNADNPIETDVLIVDEVSMVDTKLMADLLLAITPGTRVLFVGDHNQLPSIGPGSVLRDMMYSDLPTACLTEIRRSDGGGSVVKACHAIKDGIIPTPATTINLAIGENWVHIERDRPEDIAATIVDLHKSGKTFGDLYWDFQVVSPQRGRVAFGCDGLNGLLSDRINPVTNEQMAIQAAMNGGSSGNNGNGNGNSPPFRIGDKVVRTKNGDCDELHLFVPIDEHDLKSDWSWDGQEWAIEEGYIVNGDMGTIKDILTDSKGSYVIVQFINPDRLCRLPFSEHNITQAYAMTCHRCQGSGFPFVIVPVHESVFSGLATREWIYTAISRTEQLLVTVGQFSAISAAVKRKTVHLRRTRLVERIYTAFGWEPAGSTASAGQAQREPATC